MMGREDRQGECLRRGEVPVRTGGERRKHEEDGIHRRLRKVARSGRPAAAYGAERGPGERKGPPKMAPPGGEAKGIKPLGVTGQGKVALALAPW